MTEEIKEEKTECKCIVHCECVRKFFIVALGSFVGVFCALCLFTALHRPPCGPCPVGPNMRPPMEQHQQFDHKCFKGGEHHPMPPMEKPVEK